MAGLEPLTSAVRINRSTNWATTTAQSIQIFSELCAYLNHVNSVASPLQKDDFVSYTNFAPSLFLH